MTSVLPTSSMQWPERFTLANEWPRGDQGLRDIEAWLNAETDPRLIIIDTLAQFREPPNGNKNSYAEDNAAVSGMQKLASKYNIGVVVVHHDRKAGSR